MLDVTPRHAHDDGLKCTHQAHDTAESQNLARTPGQMLQMTSCSWFAARGVDKDNYGRGPSLVSVRSERVCRRRLVANVTTALLLPSQLWSGTTQRRCN